MDLNCGKCLYRNGLDPFHCYMCRRKKEEEERKKKIGERLATGFAVLLLILFFVNPLLFLIIGLPFLVILIFM